MDDSIVGLWTLQQHGYENPEKQSFCYFQTDPGMVALGKYEFHAI